MDGGNGPSLRVTELRFRLMPGKQIRLFNINDPKIVPITWDFTHAAFGRRRASKLDVVWIVLRQNFDDRTPSAVGLAVKLWQRLWDDNIVEIYKRVGNDWVEFQEQDWGPLNAKES